MRWVRRILVLGVLVGVMVVGWLFAAENQEPVSIHYVSGELAEIPLWQAVVGAFAGGAALVSIYTFIVSMRNLLVGRRYRKALRGLEAEIHQLRNLPLAPDSDTDVPDVGVKSPRAGMAGRNA